MPSLTLNAASPTGSEKLKTGRFVGICAEKDTTEEIVASVEYQPPSWFGFRGRARCSLSLAVWDLISLIHRLFDAEKKSKDPVNCRLALKILLGNCK